MIGLITSWISATNFGKEKDLIHTNIVESEKSYKFLKYGMQILRQTPTGTWTYGSHCCMSLIDIAASVSWKILSLRLSNRRQSD
jgi:hypothetical protein